MEALPPYQGGGSMIRAVHFEKTTYNDIPYKFESGTPTIGEVVDFAPAIEFINELGTPAIHEHEDRLFQQAREGLKSIQGVRLIGTASDASGIVSFLLDKTHLFDTGMLLDARGIAVRTGHHCTQPLMERMGIEGTCRARSEEHTSELQSLMRISYAVFCLKKKTKK